MKQDRAVTLLGILTAVCGLLAISVGKFIMGGIILLLAFGIFWNRGSGKFNDRSIYEKVVRTDLTIPRKGFEGDSIVFGPGRYKDCVVISRKKNDLDIKHITLIDNIIRDASDEYRFRDFVDPAETEVTPSRYSEFAAIKSCCILMISHLQEIIEKLSADRNAEVPESIENVSWYYHNSSEGHFRDEDGNDILRPVSIYSPFEAKIFSEEGDEMASVVPRSVNAKGTVNTQDGFDFIADRESFGEVAESKEVNGYTAVTQAGTFTIRLIPANLRANVSFNYLVEMDGELKALIGGSPNILFDTAGRCQNDLILSYDDDYLVLYAAIEIFIMTLNKKFIK